MPASPTRGREECRKREIPAIIFEYQKKQTIRMKRLNYAGAALCVWALAMTGCSSEEPLQNAAPAQGDCTLVASTGADTKTTVDDYQVKWTEGDAFYAFGGSTGVENVYGATAEFSLISGAGSTDGKFNGSLTGNKSDLEYAVYPCNVYNPADMTFTFPTDYDYPNSNAPMFGKLTSDKTKVEFGQLLSGMMRIKLNGLAASTSGGLTLGAKNITGSAKLSISEEGVASLGAITGESYEPAFLHFSNVSGDVVFDIPVPAGTYSDGINVRLIIYGGEGSDPASAQVFETPKDFVMKAGVIKEMPAISNITIDGSTGSLQFSMEVEGVSEANQALADGKKNVDIAEVASGADAILIPTSSTKDAPVTVNIASAQGDVTVKGAEESTETPVVYINAPEEIEQKLAVTGIEHVVINGKWQTVNASTGQNTLVVAAGAVVEKLVVDKGNVEVRGTVKTLERGEGNTATVAVASYDAADIQTVNTPENFTFTSVWDGASQVEPTADAEGVAQVYTAAQLAYYRLGDVPVSTSGANLPDRITTNVNLHADIDLADKPWIGMSLAAGKTFDGQNHTISRIRIEKYALNETSFYTPSACVGLFAVAKSGATIKNVRIAGFNGVADAKWAGSLVGYSHGANYENCSAENVVLTGDWSSYRMGGLIGFISGAGEAVMVSGCSAKRVNIQGNYSLGGLVGSIQGGKNQRTFTGCSTTDVTLSTLETSTVLNGGFSGGGKYYSNYYFSGSFGKFIGDVSANVTIADCTAPEMAVEEAAALGFGDGFVLHEALFENVEKTKGLDYYKKQAEQEGTAYKLLLPTNHLISPNCSTGVTIIADGQTLKEGTDYNRFTKVAE